MTTVTWHLPDGRTLTAEVAASRNMMQAAVAAGVPGIVGECGGCLSCATCHVYVDAAWIGRTGTATGNESGMLDATEAERRPESRLSCQIKVGEPWTASYCTCRLPDTHFPVILDKRASRALVGIQRKTPREARPKCFDALRAALCAGFPKAAPGPRGPSPFEDDEAGDGNSLRKEIKFGLTDSGARLGASRGVCAPCEAPARTPEPAPWPKLTPNPATRW